MKMLPAKTVLLLLTILGGVAVLSSCQRKDHKCTSTTNPNPSRDRQNKVFMSSCKWLVIATIPGRTEYGTEVYFFLASHGIRAGIGGSVVYAVEVQPTEAARAIHLLNQDPHFSREIAEGRIQVNELRTR